MHFHMLSLNNPSFILHSAKQQDILTLTIISILAFYLPLLRPLLILIISLLL